MYLELDLLRNSYWNSVRVHYWDANLKIGFHLSELCYSIHHTLAFAKISNNWKTWLFLILHISKTLDVMLVWPSMHSHLIVSICFYYIAIFQTWLIIYYLRVPWSVYVHEIATRNTAKLLHTQSLSIVFSYPFSFVILSCIKIFC